MLLVILLLSGATHAQLRNCPPLKASGDAVISYTTAMVSGGYSSLTMGILHCKTGYPKGATYSSCYDGQWSPPQLGECPSTTITIGCPPAGFPIRGNVSYSTGTKHELIPHGTKATLECFKGSKVEGPSLMVCQNGTWSPNRFGECKTIPPPAGGCADMTKPQGAEFVYSSPSTSGVRAIYSTVSLRCLTGTVLQGAMYSTCVNGKWYPSALGTCMNDPSLIPQNRCPKINVPAGADITYFPNATIITQWTTARITCLDGAEVIGPNYATCVAGVWLPAVLGKCPNNRAKCAVLPVPPGAQIIYSPNATGSAVVDGTTAILQCRADQYTFGPSTTWCSNGHWTVQLGTCSSNPFDGTCPAMPIPPAGGLSYSNGAGFGFIPNQTIVTLKCLSGKVPIGPGTSTCTSGKWVPSAVGACVDFVNSSHCHPQIEPAGGKVTLSKGHVELPAEDGVIARLTCSAGKYVVGSATSMCTGGHWVPSSLGECRDSKNGAELSCGWITAPIGMYITWSKNSFGSSFPNGTTATGNCVDKAVMKGVNQLTCVNGMWQPASFGICVGDHVAGWNPGGSCAPPTPSANMGLVYRAGEQYWIGAVKHHLLHGTLLSVKCFKGTLNGTGISSCADGRWHPPVKADCVPVS